MNKIWKKICGGMLVAALAVSSFTGTALAGEVTNTAEVQEDNLATGAYTVDITWSPMAAMFTPILEINAEADTFKVYNAAAPETSKGTGTISFADGVYTMTYTADVKEPGVTTTFTYDEEVITFTSKLYYGSASFDQKDEAENFVTYTAKMNVSSEEDTTEKEEVKAEENLTSGTYAVDITWSPMAAMFTPIVEIDAEADTFKVYNAKAPETSKGTGTISFADGVYTMTYTADVKESGVTTTFTYDEEVITFTSKLYYGSASFDQKDEAENFVTYTAEKTVLTAPEEDTEDNGAAEDTNNSNTENNGMTEDTNNSETGNNNTTEDNSSETEKEETSDVPKTGDTSNFGFLAAVGLAGAAVVMMGKKYENA